MIEKKTEELEIGRYLISDGSQSQAGSRNHCVPILDAFHDLFMGDVNYIVMPLLRPFDDPEFGFVGEVVDFVTQVIEVGGYLSPVNPSEYITGYGIHAQQT